MSLGPIPDLSSMAQQQPAVQQAGPSTPGQSAPTMLGQPSPAQQPQQQPQQQGPDQVSQGLDQGAAYYNKMLQDAQGKFGVKQALQNFFSGMAHGMLPPVQTPEFRTHQALAGLNSIAQTKAHMQTMQLAMAEKAPTPLMGMDEKPIMGPDGKTPITLPADQVKSIYASRIAGIARQQSADTSIHKPITVPGVGAFNWDDQQNKYVPVQGGQIPQHQFQPGEAEKLGFPAGTTQIPEAIYAQAARLQGTTTGRTQWLSDGAGGFIQVQNTSTRKYNTGGGPSAAPTSGGGPSAPRYQPGNGPVYAFDPKTNSTVMTTPAESQANGYTNSRKVSQANIEADRQLNNRLYDVAAKMSNYEQSINQPITDVDRAKIADLIGNDKLQFGAFGAHIPTDWLTKLTQSMSTAGLTQAAQQRLINYYNVREAMTGYTRVLTGSGRSNETNLQLNLQAMPDPTMPDNFTKQGINQFKQNIHIAGQGLPKMPGIQRADDILSPPQSTTGGGHILGGTAHGLPDGTTGNHGLFIVKGGTWTPNNPK